MKFEVIAEGLQFPEGPIAMPDGSVILVEIARGTLTRVWNGRTEVIARLGGGPNGAALGPDGAVYVCNNGGFEWRTVNGFTLPGRAPADYSTWTHRTRQCREWQVRTRVRLVRTRAPVRSERSRVRRAGRFLVYGSGQALRAPARSHGGITVIAPAGTHEHIPFPDPFTTNICFGGADMRDAYITLSGTGKLIKTRWPSGTQTEFLRLTARATAWLHAGAPVPSRPRQGTDCGSSAATQDGKGDPRTR
jgi:hypothetical protein